jgi:hypothetical protein
VCFRDTLSDVCFRGNSGKHLLVLSFSQFDPRRKSALASFRGQESDSLGKKKPEDVRANWGRFWTM